MFDDKSELNKLNPKGLPEWKFITEIGESFNTHNYLYAYQEAVDTLYKEIALDKTIGRMYLAIPMLFMMRHSMELGYKVNINYLSKYSGLTENVNNNQHFLVKLHKSLAKHFNKASKTLEVSSEIKESFKEQYDKTERAMMYFDTLDPKSMGFRYMVDTNGKPIFQKEIQVNLLNLKKQYDEAMVLLNYTVDVLKEYADYMQEMLAEYEREMKSYYGVEDYYL